MKTIASRQNSMVARFRAAARARRADRTEVLLDGTRLVHDALVAGATIHVAIVSDSAVRKQRPRLISLVDALASHKIEIIRATDSVMAAVSPVRAPSGAVALAAVHPAPLDDIFAAPGLAVVAAGVQDPGNVGAIIRAADAGGARGVIVTATAADPFGWRALRGAMASTFRVPVAMVETTLAAVEAARAHDVRILAATPRGGTPLERIDFGSRALVLVGAEGSGLDQSGIQTADDRLSIPMRDPVQSLNTAVAAALIIYEARRRRATRVTKRTHRHLGNRGDGS